MLTRGRGGWRTCRSVWSARWSTGGCRWRAECGWNGRCWVGRACNTYCRWRVLLAAYCSRWRCCQGKKNIILTIQRFWLEAAYPEFNTYLYSPLLLQIYDVIRTLWCYENTAMGYIYYIASCEELTNRRRDGFLATGHNKYIASNVGCGGQSPSYGVRWHVAWSSRRRRQETAPTADVAERESRACVGCIGISQRLALNQTPQLVPSVSDDQSRRRRGQRDVLQLWVARKDACIGHVAQKDQMADKSK